MPPAIRPGTPCSRSQSGKQSMMVLGDTTQHPALFARHPDWQPQFDIDGPLAVTTRKKLLDRAAADRMLVTGYHFPFPACGHIVKPRQRLRARAPAVEYLGLMTPRHFGNSCEQIDA